MRVCDEGDHAEAERFGFAASGGWEFNGVTAVVTGAGSGIGGCVARALAWRGADIVAIGRRPEPLRQLRAELEHAGRRCFVGESDVRDDAGIARIVDESACELGAPGVLVNCAGISGPVHRLENTQIADLEATFNVNVVGALTCAKALLPQMKSLGWGRIVNITSVAAHIGIPRLAAYSMSKSAMCALTRSMAVEWARFGICANSVAPGFVKTAMNENARRGPFGAAVSDATPAGRWGEGCDLIGAVLLLSSRLQSFVNGTEIVVDGGFSRLWNV